LFLKDAKTTGWFIGKVSQLASRRSKHCPSQVTGLVALQQVCTQTVVDEVTDHSLFISTFSSFSFLPHTSQIMPVFQPLHKKM
jgi:hypothetical protein